MCDRRSRWKSRSVVLAALHDHPEWNAALYRRGIVDRSTVQIDPWPAGTFGLCHEEGRRITRCLAYLRESKTTTATPVRSRAWSPPWTWPARYSRWSTPGSPHPTRDGTITPKTAADAHQPEAAGDHPARGPELRRGRQLGAGRSGHCGSMDPLEGLVLCTVGYDDGGRSVPSSIAPRAARWSSPTAIQARSRWKNAFDAGEWGSAAWRNSLKLGCDCLGEIRYLDAVLVDERGEPQRSERDLHARGGLRDPLEAR